MTDREINELVARKLGWKECECAPEHRATHRAYMPHKHNMPDYCHSIAAAWEIVAELEKRDLWLKLFDERGYGDGWTVNLDDCKNRTQADASGDTAPMAICLAFLKLDSPSIP